MPAARADVRVNVEPELDDRSDVDAPALLAAVERILTIGVLQWRRIVDTIATEVEDAVATQSAEETTALRDDLDLRSVIVFHEAILLSLAAPKQFPDSWIRAQLDDDLAVDDVVVEGKDADVEMVEFGSLDDLLDVLSSADDD
ncbi:cytochrome C5 [Rhodococcus sp. IEGM 1379]|uniref:cytochrome C5 n=1 Tax=Rhodococcus sp. IEGM 1379 TaxID=3047086 RepID=UPI0024B6780E|nr:cytochrome C5 [Rhodococcus sp. IEGM 1379]MDI9917673.1 cytochrome C5 [Rhodococcus sp. IEGM 1379]